MYANECAGRDTPNFLFVNRKDYKHFFTVFVVSLLMALGRTCPSEFYPSWRWIFYWLLIQSKKQNNLKAIVEAFWGLHNWGKQMILRIISLEHIVFCL